MAEIVNLRRARKKAKQLDQSQQAALNRAASGRSKSEIELEQARVLKARRDLELHRIEREDGA